MSRAKKPMLPKPQDKINPTQSKSKRAPATPCRQPKTRWYAVAHGVMPGIYTTWSECQKQIWGYSGAQYKAFSNLNDASAWMRIHGVDTSGHDNVLDDTPQAPSIRTGSDTLIPARAPMTSDTLDHRFLFQSHRAHVDAIIDGSLGDIDITNVASSSIINVARPAYNKPKPWVVHQHNPILSSYTSVTSNSQTNAITPSLLETTMVPTPHDDTLSLPSTEPSMDLHLRHWTRHQNKHMLQPRSCQSPTLPTSNALQSNVHLAPLLDDENTHHRKVFVWTDGRASHYLYQNALISSHTTMEVYSDGSATGNGSDTCRAGYGMYWGDQHPLNRGFPLPHVHGYLPSSNRAELAAILHTLIIVHVMQPKLRIYSDSSYAINCITKWGPSWIQRGQCKTRKNMDLIGRILDLLKIRAKQAPSHAVVFVKVKAHSGIPGNEHADILAKEGAAQCKRVHT